MNVDTAKHYLEQAYGLKDAHEFKKALKACDLAILATPINIAEAHNLRGIILGKLGRKPEALKAFREAVRLEPTFMEAQKNVRELENELHLSASLPENKAFQGGSMLPIVLLLGVVACAWLFSPSGEALCGPSPDGGFGLPRIGWGWGCYALRFIAAVVVAVVLGGLLFIRKFLGK